ncbi:hypothetical protein ABZ719_13400 [Streptomyces sp. NPDC006743]|uniref:hypothetical protein n=1 Tax=Streptomyces sp. NPDC006743 TaxID=3154480 RepID=UPI00345279AE
MQVHEQMHVHAECLDDYSFDEPFTGAVVRLPREEVGMRGPFSEDPPACSR